MEINNIEVIKPFLKFDDESDFYYLQILQRKKENPQLGSNSRVIKNYYINSVDYLGSHYEEIKQLCRFFNVRASIRLNRRSYEKVAYKAMVNIANSMSNKEFSFIKKSYDRAVGTGNNEPKDTKTWILDWDGPVTIDKIKAVLQILGDNFLDVIPSKSGVHIIVSPFDAREFSNTFPDVEIHKDNPTNLFIP